MEAFYAEFPMQSNPSEPHQHEGAEFIYVIKGQLAVNIDEENIVLEEGDAMYFASGAPHSYRREGRSACTANRLNVR
jgi:quercetin dioxygenase-like cupin family protein